MAKHPNASQQSLDKKIADMRAEVMSDRMSMSIGELAGLYERRELDIHPKFQRVLRWSPQQKTGLIESILLRIPIPPIFVSQDEESRWDVVDGVQRLGTIFEFLGNLKDANGNARPGLQLSGTNLLPELDGFRFDSQDNTTKVFTPAMRLDFRRSRLDLNIILKESTESSKYELFERLNTGGAIASPQEVRNCVLVWMNEPFFDWMKHLCDHPSFVDTTPLSERLIVQQFRAELLLRFLALHHIDVLKLRGIKDLSEFLNAQNRTLAKSDMDKHEVEKKFRRTFDLLNSALEGDVFRKFDHLKDRFTGPFLISSFESIALGVAYNFQEWSVTPNATAKLRDKVKELWNKAEFIEHIGIGISSSSRMVHTVPLGREHFKP